MALADGEAVLASISLEDYLGCLDVPAVVLSHHNESESLEHFTVVYANKALLSLLGLDELPSPHIAINQYVAQREREAISVWLRAVNTGTEPSSAAETFIMQTPRRAECGVTRPTPCRITWSARVIKGRAVVLEGRVEENVTYQMQRTKEVTTHCWRKVSKLVCALSGAEGSHSFSGGGKMGEMLRNFDWSTNPLGPIDQWPQSLLTATSLCLASSFPMSIWWGPEFVLIYNDGYSAIAGQKHPWLFGKTGAEGWSELWKTLKPLADGVMRGEPCFSEDHQFFMRRNNFSEETYHTWSYIPIRQEDGSVGGLLNPSIEGTARVLYDRRIYTLTKMGVGAASARTIPELFNGFVDVMVTNPCDIPFAMIYIMTVNQERKASDLVAIAGGGKDRIKITELSLQATVKIERGHPASPETIAVVHDADGTSFTITDGTVWPINEAIHSGEIVIIDDVARLCNDMAFSLPSGGWEEAVRSVAVCPIAATKAEGVIGVLVMGLNSRRPFDHAYRTFLELLCRHIATSYTGVKAFEDQVERAKGFAALDSAKTDFFSSVSHELRTPLTLILGPVEDMLRDSKTLGPIKTQIGLVRRNALRLLRLVNSLLDFSRVEAGRMQPCFALTDISQLSGQIASVFRSAVEKGNLEYSVKCEDTAVQVYIDTEKWEKIVYNLIGNAFKYTTSGKISVRVYPAADGDSVVFEVSDTGIGVPQEELSKIFDRFYRVKNQDGRSYEGSGIGLALCHEFVKMHGGVLSVKSELGKGSTFNVRIPLGKNHLPEDSIIVVGSKPYASEQSYGMSLLDELARWRTPATDDDLSQGSGSNSNSSTSSSSTATSDDSTSRRIMLVDDNEDMRGYAKSLLCKRWIVEEARNGQIALESIIANPPDLVISDVMMPVLGGLGLVRALRREETTKLVPFILVSAHAGNEASVDGLAAGADDYLVKPFSGRELIARAQTHLELGVLRRELEERVKLRTLELETSEFRYKNLAKLMPVGIFRADASGKLTYTNDKYWDMVGGSRDDVSDVSSEPLMLNSIHPNDRAKVKETLLSCMLDVKPCKIEFQWGHGDVEKWCLLQMVTENDPAIQSHCFLGALTDVTDRKTLEKERLETLRLATEQQRSRAEEAEGLKRQLELFVDTICHELRNPLNGIYHNANLLVDDLSRFQGKLESLKELICKRTLRPKTDASIPTADDQNAVGLTEWLESQILQSFDSLKTIAICGRHQKRIADDVLHMSKLHMNLFVLASVDYHAETEIANVMKIFDVEVRAKGIDVTFTCTENYRCLQLGYVKGDPTRLSQIIVNILSNAIRFTVKSKVKKIDVTLDATQEDPSTLACYENIFRPMIEGASNGISPSHKLASVASANTVYLLVTIKDTGCGITQEAQTRLFSRFTQAVGSDFGGHGLGLFISKSLVELQGGQITLESVKNEGTTFKFYIRTERCELQAIQTGALSAEMGTKVEIAQSDQRTRELEFLQHSNWNICDKAAELKQSISTETVLKKTIVVSPITEKKNLNAKCILVVEDNLVNQKVLCRLLQRSGFSTTVANHGVEAIDILRTSRAFSANETSSSATSPQFELILMDLEMPKMNGLEATSVIRQYEAEGLLKGYIPIMAVSGNARQEYIDKATNAGMDDFLIKPYQEEELMLKVKSLLEASRLRSISTPVS